MRKILFGLAVAALALLSTQRATADLITNGGFETGDFTGWTTVPATLGSDFGVSSGNAHTGNYAAFFGAVTPPFHDAIYQTLPTQAGATYSISYWLQNAGGLPSDFQVSWNGSVISDVNNANSFPYTEYSFTETATSSSTVLQFAAYQVPSFFFLDDVSVSFLSPPSASAPEPASLTLCGIAALSLAGYGRLRRKTAAKA